MDERVVSAAPDDEAKTCSIPLGYQYSDRTYDHFGVINHCLRAE